MINKYKDNYRRRYSILFVVSFLIHLSVVLWLLYNPIKPQPVQSKSVKITLSSKSVIKSKKESKLKEEKPAEQEKQAVTEAKKKEEAKKQEQPEKQAAKKNKVEESHAPRHTADEFASSNQTDRTKTKLIDGGAIEPKSDKTELSNNQKTTTKTDKKIEIAKKKEIGKKAELAKKDKEKVDSRIKDAKDIVIAEGAKAEAIKSQEKSAAQTSYESLFKGNEQEKSDKAQLAEIDKLLGDFDYEGENQEPEFDMEASIENKIGNVALLNESQLRDVEVQDPFSEKESKQVQLVNRYLQRMNAQVKEVWVNPYTGKKMYRGVIRFELNSNGELVDSFIYKSSGLNDLDQSALKALHAVKRYLVPENFNDFDRYYRNLRFFYSSIEEETELMPFELDE